MLFFWFSGSGSGSTATSSWELGVWRVGAWRTGVWAGVVVVPETASLRGTVSTAVRLTGRVHTDTEYAGRATIQPG